MCYPVFRVQGLSSGNMAADPTKSPGTLLVYTLTLKYLGKDYFNGQICTARIHGPSWPDDLDWVLKFSDSKDS